MRVSYKWLQEYVQTDLSPEEIARRLTLAGLEVDEIEYMGQDIENVVVALVEERVDHPKSDHLSICQVFDGECRRQVVCGAPNVAAGQKVPLAKPGAKLPGGVEIGHAKLVGVESDGMICSSRELGLDQDHSGILVLDPELPLGMNIVEALDIADSVLLLELTPNRADCLGMLNVAREVAAISGAPFFAPTVDYVEMGPDIAGLVSIRVEDPQLCPRYLGRVVQGIQVGPSPKWMQRCLIAAGMRPINNVVDISNYVMLETGQPTHIFDYDKIGGKKVIVRQARDGEKLITLDQKERLLDTDALLICDAEEPICMAGVMGGLESEVTAQTRNVFIESACFDPVSIRRTSRRQNLISEASMRYEKGLNIEGIDRASRRIVQLLLEYGGTQAVACRNALDVRVPQRPETTVLLRPQKVNDVLGTDYSLDEIAAAMRALAFPLERQGDALLVTVPYYRLDISIEEDLIEEVARLKGFDQIPVTLPASATAGLRNARQQFNFELRRFLAGLGLHEILNYTFVSPKEADKLLLPAAHPLRRSLAISNPISENQSIMRTSLAGSVLEALARNYSRRNLDLALFEVGTRFLPQGEEIAQPRELPTLAIVLSGEADFGWQGGRLAYDYFYLKGILEGVFDRFHVSGCEFHALNQNEALLARFPYLHPGRSAVILCDGKELGYLGEVHPKVLANFELEKPAMLLEIDLDLLFASGSGQPACEDLPRFPASARDMALIVAQDIPAAAIEKEIWAQGGPYLRKVELFDMYDKAPIPNGYRSLAYNLVYQDPEQTLTDAQINASFDAITGHLAEKWGVRLR